MDTFMDNCTVGMVKYLEKLPCVNSVTVVEKNPVEESSLVAWEQLNKCTLPSDLRHFYSVTDGLQVKWTWKMQGDSLPGGFTEIVPLEKMSVLTSKSQSSRSELPGVQDIESDSEDGDERKKPRFKDKYKAFAIDICQGTGKVCLVFPKKKDIYVESVTPPAPTIWFLDWSLDWHYLAPSFTSYFRMAIGHLGILQWQYLYTPIGPPSRTYQLLYMLSPEKQTKQRTKLFHFAPETY